MKPEPLRRVRFAILLSLGMALLGACATSSDIDGGIVGTGNRIDCAALAKAQQPGASVPRECQ